MHVMCQCEHRVRKRHFILMIVINWWINFGSGCKISVISYLISHFHSKLGMGTKQKLIIRLMRQLVCFNFHYFIKTVCWLFRSISNQNIIVLQKKSLFRLSPFLLAFQALFFIEPIKAFYLMNAIKRSWSKEDRQ